VIKPTINGVLDIMKACMKAKTVRRLVFTSSAGTINVVEHQKPIFDETCWSDVEFCRRVKMTGWVSDFFFSLVMNMNNVNTCAIQIFIFEHNTIPKDQTTTNKTNLYAFFLHDFSMILYVDVFRF